MQKYITYGSGREKAARKMRLEYATILATMVVLVIKMRYKSGLEVPLGTEYW